MTSSANMRHRALAFLAVLCTLLASIHAAHAASFCVNSEGSLQLALTTAGANSESDDIRLQTGTYALTALLYYVPSESALTTVSGGWNSNCSVQSPDATASVLDAGGTQQILALNAPLVAADFRMQNLTLRKGSADLTGGCLYIATGGSFTLEHVWLQQCSAGTFNNGVGGGVYVAEASSVLIADSKFEANQAGDGAALGLATVAGEDLTITHSQFVENSNAIGGAGQGASAISTATLATTNGGYLHSVSISESSFESGTGYAVWIAADTVLVAGSAFRNNTDTSGNLECGYLSGNHDASHTPATNGMVTISGSTFVGSGAFGSQCFSLSAGWDTTPAVAPADIEVRNSSFSGFTAGVLGTLLSGIASQQVVLSGNTFSDNSGGAAVIPACDTLVVTHNRFQRNQSFDAGAIYAQTTGSMTADDNLFESNVGGVNGGAVLVTIAAPNANVHFSNNTFVGNQTSGYGGGLGIASAYDATPSIELWNNLFWGNTSAHGKGNDIYFDNDFDQDFVLTPITLNNNTYTAGTAGYYPRIPVAPLGSGNFTATDPLFVNAAGADYRLGASSPMVDKGNNNAPGILTADLAGLPRIDGNSIDVGAFEYNNDLIFQSGFEEINF